MSTVSQPWHPLVGALVRIKGTSLTGTVVRINGGREESRFVLSPAVNDRLVYWIEELEPAPAPDP
jgi:hypothetical protein